MKLKILLLSSLLFVTAFSPLAAEIPGDWDVIVPKVPPAEKSFDKVHIVEVFSFTCSHCYEFNKEVEFIKKVFGDKIQIDSVPIAWGGPNPGKFYYIAKEAGIGEKIKSRIFEFAFDRNEGNKIYNMEVLRGIAILEGIQNLFDEKMKTPEISNKVKEGVRFAKVSKIESTPTLVIEGAIKTSRDPINLFPIINSLLKEPVKEPLKKYRQLIKAEQERLKSESSGVSKKNP